MIPSAQNTIAFGHAPGNKGSRFDVPIVQLDRASAFKL